MKRAYSDKIRAYALKQRKEYLPCPRCGKDNMNEDIFKNALSRYEDIYVCSDCGTQEAFNDFLGVRNDFSEWVLEC